MARFWRSWADSFFSRRQGSARKPRSPRLECLEDRLAPAVTITGTVFDDSDGNGSFAGSEVGRSGVTVFVDLDGAGTFDAGEPSATTGSDGTYTLIAPAGTLQVRQVVPAGAVQTTSNPADLTLADGESMGGVDFGTFTTITISGTVFNDTDNSGSQGTGETGLSGVTVFLDGDGDGQFDTGETSTTTDGSGAFSFAALGPGTYHVRVVVPTGAVQTTTSPDVTATSGTDATGQTFGLFSANSISGTVFEDVDGNGTQGASETTGVSGVTVYLDTNNSGGFDSGDPSTTTGADGTYSFGGLVAGTYSVRIVALDGTVQTTTNPADVVLNSGDSATAVNFGTFTQITLSGNVFNDVNGDGAYQSGDVGIQNVTVYLDANNSGGFDSGDPTTTTDANGDYHFDNLGPGTYRVRVVAPAGTVQTSAAPADVVASSDSNEDRDFALFTRISISGTAFDDGNGDGIQDAGETGLANVTVFLDTDNDGALDSGETSTTTAADGTYSFSDLGPGTYHVRTVLSAGAVQTSDAIDVVASSDTDATAQDLAIQAQRLSVTATVPTTSEATGTPPGSFTITRSGSTAAALTVTYFISGTAGTGSDYQALSGTAVIRAGESSVTVSVTPVDDSIAEGAETVVLTIGTGDFQVTTASATVTIQDNEPPALAPDGNRIFVVSSTNGTVQSYDGKATAPQDMPTTPFAGYLGQLESAAADFNGDGVTDLVLVVAGGAQPHVKVFDGRTMAELASFYAFDATYMGGLSVAVGDFNGDGRADLLIGAASGDTGGAVKIIDGSKLNQLRSDGVIADSAVLASIHAFEGYAGGVRVAAGDFTGDSVSDFAVAAVDGVTHVKTFSGKTLSVLASFTLTRNDTWGASLRLAAGDLDNDGKAELLLSYNSGGDTLIHVFDSTTGAERSQLTPFVGFKGAVSLDSLVNGNTGRADVVFSSASGDLSHLKVMDALDSVFASFYVPGFGAGGVRVSGL